MLCPHCKKPVTIMTCERRMKGKEGWFWFYRWFKLVKVPVRKKK